MKKYLLTLMLAPVAMLWSCNADEGTDPGHDSEPNVVVYSYSPESSKGLNPDNDVTVRFSTNSATTALYYLVEPEADVEAELKANGEDAYAQKVIANGTKIEVKGAETKDVDLTGIYGNYTITAVATNGGAFAMGSVAFQGLDWSDVASGSFLFNQAFLADEGTECTLQVCKTDASLYRLKDAFGEGYHMKVQKLSGKYQDADGIFQLARIPLTQTPYQISLTTGGPYPIVVEDIGYWQGNSAFVTNVNQTGYINYFYDDNSIYFRLAWGADRGGDGIGVFSYQDMSAFIPDQD